MGQHKIFQKFLLATSIIFLGIFAIQYPLSTKFPIGGDAAAHARVATTLLNFRIEPNTSLAFLARSNYPFHDLTFAAASVFPTTWPERFTWWIVTGHIFVGLALGLFLGRVAGWPAAATGIAIWALTPIAINSHFEDATAPQLWSLIFIVLTLERIHASSVMGTLIFLTLTYLFHPLSGLVLFAALAFGTLILLPVRSQLTARQASLIKFGALLVAVLFAVSCVRLLREFSWPSLDVSDPRFFILDMLKSKFAPWLVLGLVGVAVMIRRLKRHLPILTGLLGFIWFALILTNNSVWQISIAENRFHTYFVLATVITASLAFPALLDAAFASRLGRATFAFSLFATLGVLTWRDNQAVFSYYTDPGNHASLHPEVQSAFAWLHDNLPADSFIATSAASRFTEWTPILTNRRWEELNAASPLLVTNGEELYQAALTAPYTHILFLTDQEDISAGLIENPEWFPPVYNNNAVVVFALP